MNKEDKDIWESVCQEGEVNSGNAIKQAYESGKKV